MTGSTIARRERLASIKEKLGQARAERTQAARQRDAAREANDANAEAVADIRWDAANTEVEINEQLQDQLVHAIGGGGSNPLGMEWQQNPQAQSMLSEIATSGAPLTNFQKVGDLLSADELAAQMSRGIQAAGITLPTDPIGGTSLPVQPTPAPPQDLIGLFPSFNQQDRIVAWMQRSGIAVADVSPHGSVKPQATLTYVDQSEEALTVSVWAKMNRQDAEDYDGVTADLQEAQRYGVRAKCEQLLVAAILGATGVAIPDFTPWTDVDNAIDRLIVAVAEQRLTGANVTFAAMNPLDAAAVAIGKGQDGHYTFDSSPFAAGGPMAGVTPVQSAGLARGTALIGDSGIGAKVGIRSGLAVFVGQEQDDMTRNKLTFLCETRVTPIVTVPSVFSKVALV